MPATNMKSIESLIKDSIDLIEQSESAIAIPMLREAWVRCEIERMTEEEKVKMLRGLVELGQGDIKDET